MDLSILTDLQKESKKSFNEQKALIKKVLAGRKIKCTQCKNVIDFVLTTDTAPARIQCEQGCTDIELDIVNEQ